MKKILIISNDEIYLDNNSLSSNFNDTINIIQSLKKKFKILLLSRKINKKQFFDLNTDNQIQRFKFEKKIKNDFFFIVIISLTPRNFIYLILIKYFFRKKLKGIIYLRSNGYLEYKIKFGKLASLLYKKMLSYVSNHLKIISVCNSITNEKIYSLVRPSELSNEWFEKFKQPTGKVPKLLYIGRFKKEKGIFSLLQIIKKFKINFSLTIAGDHKVFKHKKPSKVFYFKELITIENIIEFYDNHHIFILPSFTEGYPKVILESLSRRRPVIVFDEISHVKRDFNGIFVCERNHVSLQEKINYIMKNYKSIQNQLKSNILPTKKNFQKEFNRIINELY